MRHDALIVAKGKEEEGGGGGGGRKAGVGWARLFFLPLVVVAHSTITHKDVFASEAPIDELRYVLEHRAPAALALLRGAQGVDELVDEVGHGPAAAPPGSRAHAWRRHGVQRGLACVHHFFFGSCCCFFHHPHHGPCFNHLALICAVSPRSHRAKKATPTKPSPSLPPSLEVTPPSLGVQSASGAHNPRRKFSLPLFSLVRNHLPKRTARKIFLFSLSLDELHSYLSLSPLFPKQEPSVRVLSGGQSLSVPRDASSNTPAARDTNLAACLSSRLVPIRNLDTSLENSTILS